MTRPFIPTYVLCSALCVLAAPAWAGTWDDVITYTKMDQANRLKPLLLRGVDPNTLADDGTPILMLAMQNESVEVVNLLLTVGKLDPNMADLKGETPLMLAANANRLDWVQALLKRGANLGEDGQWTALHYAASKGYLSVVEALLKGGAAIDIRSPNSTTPIMMAARSGQEDMVRLLIKRGADTSVVNDAGYNAAGYALKAQKKELAFEIMRRDRELRRQRLQTNKGSE